MCWINAKTISIQNCYKEQTFWSKKKKNSKMCVKERKRTLKNERIKTSEGNTQDDFNSDFNIKRVFEV
jgi:hypothetical protein